MSFYCPKRLKDKEQLRKEIQEIFIAGIEEVHAGTCIRQSCSLDKNILTIKTFNFDLEKYNNIYVVGGGKATAAMAFELEQILGNMITSGVISVKYKHIAELKYIKLIEAGHPVPDMNGNLAAEEIFQTVENAGENDLVICLISGGGSALMPLPVSTISLKDKQALTKALLLCGADIHEINTFRKNLSKIKGGGLAHAGFPATIITLMISDVVGDDLGTIASGPTIKYSGAIDECLEIIDKYHIRDKVPASILKYLKLNSGKQNNYKLLSDKEKFKNVFNFIIGKNIDALIAAKSKAEELGYNTLILSSSIEGETKHAAHIHCSVAREIVKSGNPLPKPACILTGGETTIKVSGDGLGGRNMEFVLEAAFEISNYENIIILSGGTDGTDGATEAAGAIADSETITRAGIAGLDPVKYLLENNSYNFFYPLNDLLITGPTNTNVMDLRIMLIT
jgi:hydroxypyruvate reductase